MATENRTNGTAIYKDLRKIKPITIEIDEVAIYARKEFRCFLLEQIW